MLFLVGNRDKPKIKSLEEFSPQLEEEFDYYFFTPHLLTLKAHVQIDLSLDLKQLFGLLKASLEKGQKVLLVEDPNQLIKPLSKHFQPHHYLSEKGLFYLAPSIRSKIKSDNKTQSVSFQDVTDSLLQLLI